MKSEMTYATNFISISIDSQPLAVEGLSIGSHGNYNYTYFLNDHLGSTRMVLAQDGTVKEALMYQPYGTVSDVQAISASRADPLRDKFTTKEFDEEGPEFGQIKFDLTFDFALTHTDPTKPNRVEVYYAHAPSNPEIIYVTLDAASKGKITTTLNNATSRTIASIQFKLNDDAVICNVQNINEVTNPGTKFTITKIASAISEFTPTELKTFLTYSNESFYMAGIGAYHFGARIYDPALGVWFSRDALEQYLYSYGYATNPIMTIDPSGLWSIGLGLLFGYTREGGFHLGFGVSGDFGQGMADLSYKYNFGDNS